MVYGVEAVLPSDLEHDAPRVVHCDEAKAELERQDSLDLLEEERESVLARLAIYQQQLHRYHGRQVRGQAFNAGDLLLRLNQDKEGHH